MATISANSLLIINDPSMSFGSPVSIDPGYNDRLAGTSFVGATPMVGFVMAISLIGPTIAGVSEIAEDGTWEILGIAQRHAGEDLLVIGVPRNSSENFAMAGRIQTV